MTDEHGIKIESTQIYHGYVEPYEAELLTGDGDPPERSVWSQPVSFDLEFKREEKLIFECECGQRFRKPQTARDHLEEIQS